MKLQEWYWFTIDKNKYDQDENVPSKNQQSSVF